MKAKQIPIILVVLSMFITSSCEYKPPTAPIADITQVSDLTSGEENNDDSDTTTVNSTPSNDVSDGEEYICETSDDPYSPVPPVVPVPSPNSPPVPPVFPVDYSESSDIPTIPTIPGGSTPPPGGDDPGDDYYPGEENFGELTFNGFVSTSEDNLSTFSFDVDEGSYTFGRNKINSGILPPEESVRIEEYINYFQQDYESPLDDPFSVHVDGSISPFRPDSLHILRIGIKGKELDESEISEIKDWNLTFLIDVSGSMTSRLNLVKESLFILVDNMRSNDKISICTYAGSVTTVLEPTSLTEMGAEEIKSIICDLVAGGSTAMGSGIQNAYDINQSGFIDDGVNRVIVCSDGDANVGSVSPEEILEMISDYVETGITLSTIGFGNGNYNDLMMEQLADNGNGNYYYIDDITEAERVFRDNLFSMLYIIAKDVKVQVEFNMNSVIRYRLIGYENRAIEDEDFEDPTTDAGEIGPEHTSTALYEVELSDFMDPNICTVHLLYKMPNGEEDVPLDIDIPSTVINNDFNSNTTARFRFTVGVGEYAEILRGSPYVNTSFESVIPIIEEAVYNGNFYEDDFELLELIEECMEIE